ncbi:MAG: RsmE family RNA methyltransferase [Acidobacteria bacterium]|nr:RsmE family RNA methyltransferase [Acidobacteriota bacterium]
MSAGSVRAPATVYLQPAVWEGAEAEVSGDQYRHLFRAKRLAVGELLRAVDGRGRAREARVGSVGPAAAVVELGAEAPSNEAARRLTLIVAVLRPERASWLVEKATELGAHRFVWLRTGRAPRHFGPSVLERHRRVAVAAMQQSGRSWLPDVDGPHDWQALPGLLEGFEARRVLDPAGRRLTAMPDEAERVAVVVGPEGGWGEAERRELEKLGCEPRSLGPRILRVETAAIAGAALLLSGAGPRR